MLSVTMAALNASQKEMNVTANNLANASTIGFKRSYANFGDVFSNDPASNPKTAVGAGVLLTSVARDTTAGALKSTGRVTDLAIDGRGYFITRDPAGTANTYSRAGNFSIDANGYIVDPGGFRLMGFPNSGGNQSTLTAIKAPTQIDAGTTLPDGTTYGQKSQLISFSGAATSTGIMNVGGVDVSIANGDSIQQIATKVRDALSSSQSFSGRTVTVEGTGNNAQVKIVFGANENINSPITITTPAVAAPVSWTAPQQVIAQPEIQAIPTVIDNGPDITYITFDDHVTTPPLTINFPQALNEADTVSYLLNDYATNPSRYAPYLVDRTVDLTNFLNGTGPVTVSFDETVNNPLCTVTTSNGVSVDFDQIQQAILSPKTEEFTFSATNIAGDLKFSTINGLNNIAIPNAGTVSIDTTDTPQSIANKVQTQLQAIFPNRTITVNNDKVIMTYQASESASPLVGITMTAKKPTTATATLNSDSSIASILLQGLSISPKGEVVGTYSNGQAYNLGNIGIASFANDGGLKAIGNNRYAETGLSGAASMTTAGAPKAGNIMTGALEQANVDITNELMDMIRAQQVYNGNARMLQTTIETVGRITDKI